MVAGGLAWLLSRVLRSPDVATVVACPPPWLDRADVVATLAAIHLAASALEAGLTARERETAIEAGAVAAHSDPDWTVGRAADYLRLSPRRVQELACELGGRKVGRQWLLDEVAVRVYERARGVA